MTDQQPFNPWGPCIWEGDENPRPWHNLPPVIGATPPEKTMEGLAVGFAFSQAQTAAEVPALAAAAYGAWQEGYVGKAFTARATELAATMGWIEVGLTELINPLAEAVTPFGGGVVLAQSLLFLTQPNPAFDDLWGAPPTMRTLDGCFEAVQKLLAVWAQAWQAPGQKPKNGDAAQVFIHQLAALTLQDMTELDPTTLGDLSQTHLLQFMRMFFGEPNHVMDTALQTNLSRHTAWLQQLELTNVFDAFGQPATPDPLGLQLKGLLQQVALEGVYLPPLPRFMDGQPLSLEAVNAMRTQPAWQTLAKGLLEITQSATFKRLPSWQGVVLPPLNRRSVLEHFINSTRRNAIGGHN